MEVYLLTYIEAVEQASTETVMGSQVPGEHLSGLRNGVLQVKNLKLLVVPAIESPLEEGRFAEDSRAMNMLAYLGLLQLPRRCDPALYEYTFSSRGLHGMIANLLAEHQGTILLVCSSKVASAFRKQSTPLGALMRLKYRSAMASTTVKPDASSEKTTALTAEEIKLAADQVDQIQAATKAIQESIDSRHPLASSDPGGVSLVHLMPSPETSSEQGDKKEPWQLHCMLLLGGITLGLMIIAVVLILKPWQ